MKIKTYIELGEQKAGKQTELVKILGIKENFLRNAKSGRSGLPDAICIKLANYIEVNALHVIAASNLVTEKDEERRKIFESCFSKVANFTIAAFILSVFSMMTPSPANASQQSLSANSSAEVFVLC